MKKIYFLLFTFIATLSYGQELLVNGSFDSWDDANTPTGFTHIESVDQEASEFHTGLYSAKHTGGTSDLGQTITGIVPGTSYTLSLWYKVEAGTGDGDDARIWSKWAMDGALDHTTDAAVLQGPGNAYFDNNGNVWTEYSVTVTAPATANEFYFEVRTYSGAVVYWDDLSFFQEAGAVPTLSITSPTDGETIPSADVDINFSVQNFVVGNPGAGIDGHLHYYLDGAGSPTMIYNTDPINLTGLSAGTHTLVLELVDNSHQPLPDPVSTSVTFDVVVPTQVADLTELRTGTIGEFYQIMNTPTVTFTRTNRNQKYIQDSSNSAILIDDAPGVISTSFAIGDGMSGLVGKLGAFGGVLQFIPSVDASVTTGATITPQVVTINDLLTDWEPYESELVQIDNTTFADAGGTFSVTNYDISDTSGGPMVFRPFSGTDYIGETIPSGAISMVAIVAEFGGAPQVSARSLSDVTLSTSSFELNEFSVYPNPTSTGFVNISSKTNDTIQVSVFDILGKQVLTNTLNNNRLNVSTLTTGVYIMKISQNGNSITKKLVVR
ncbi:T9SS type A sorting domain-containing protein [Xanthomarina sp. GH4-25]|uniref:T9SS type A sorting domain-containing protein n=1 Tax=Xanthomarina sp. GH4-25 TaxID=3349335 RepID=UPI000D675D8D|nr:hypothetical protein DI383_04715 [Flavobacteriaceae bacterium LYZ1037]